MAVARPPGKRGVSSNCTGPSKTTGVGDGTGVGVVRGAGNVRVRGVGVAAMK